MWVYNNYTLEELFPDSVDELAKPVRYKMKKKN